ncbi:MAG TPA: twin-arginine translocation signal domain-containing protein [Bacillota bacterium]|nr:twin-arginine translocation signal domain-containing protein [Bacillota bacterium]
MKNNHEPVETNRRGFLKRISAVMAVLLGGGTLFLRAVRGAQPERTVWQIDPLKCNQCGRCADNCVQAQSAVRCVHQYELCGYCKLCFGYFRQGAPSLTEDAENQNCPTGALTRKLVEEPYYEYTINEELCIGCGKCIKGCTAFGNGSLFLQVRQEYCLKCNQCSIALHCPADAFRRIPEKSPYIIKRCHE